LAISSIFSGDSSGQERYAFQRQDNGSISESGIAATFRVRPGQSIQAAVDRAEPGDRIEVEPGLYNQTVMVDKAGITLTGIIQAGERPILDGLGTMGDAVQVSGNDFLIEGFLIRNYAGNGVVASKTENIVFRDLIVDKTGLYGVYPVECTGVLIEDCVATGIADAAIYVGQSRDIVVRNNEVYLNVAGIEIENSVNALVANNSAHHNTGGILVFVLPNNPSKIGEHCRVINNRVWANNLPNFGRPGSTVSNIPPGVGIFVMAADYTEITRNIITGNDSFGVSIISLANSSSLRGKKFKLDVQPDSDHTFVHDNAYEGNGTNPSARYKELANGRPDLFLDGTRTANVWQKAEDLKRTPAQLPGAGGALN